jgi:hypothetical protein
MIWVIQEYYLEKHENGDTDKKIIEDINRIHPISTQCFYQWMRVNARKIITEAEIDKKELNKLLYRFKEAIKL